MPIPTPTHKPTARPPPIPPASLAPQLVEAFPGLSAAAAERCVEENKDTCDDLFRPLDKCLKDTRCVAFSFERPNADPSRPPALCLGVPRGAKVERGVVYFTRSAPRGVGERSAEADLIVGRVEAGAGDEALAAYRALVGDLFRPALENQEDRGWGKAGKEGTAEFLHGVARFNTVLNEAVSSVSAGLELQEPNPAVVGGIELRPAAFQRAAEDPETVTHLEGVLRSWIDDVGRLTDDEARREDVSAVADGEGPDAELEFWRARMAKLNSVVERLKRPECRVVLGVLVAARSRVHKQWRAVDLRVADAANEAKDNVKYLVALEKSLEPMYSGSPAAVLEALPALMNNVRMMHAIARYYNTPGRMTALLARVTNQLIANCRRHLEAPGPLWEQDVPALLERLGEALRVRERYEAEYRATKKRSADQARAQGAGASGDAPPPPPFAFDEAAIFRSFDLFCKRLRKLVGLFTTVGQFGGLVEQTHVEGLGPTIKRFTELRDDMKRKPYALLDWRDARFDRDLLDFEVQVHDLETQLQSFINATFETITSTEQALDLLRQFQSILERDTLHEDLQEKYAVVFHSYGFDLEAVQALYERHKHAPPVPRNAPPIAGNIMWARQLLRRIEEPMRRFASHKRVMASREARRTVKVYNRVAQTLLKFEALWVQYFLQRVERDKAGLSATLLVRHPEEGRLLVNFDRDVLGLLREAKHLERMGIELPEAAQAVLLQEDKFKSYHTQLTHVLREAERVERAVPPALRPLLQPHIADLELKVQPGLYVLTWTSMNIDGYLAKIHRAIAALDELVRKVTDVLHNRTEANMARTAAMKMIVLPRLDSVTVPDFELQQRKAIQAKAKTLQIRNDEVQRSLDDILALLDAYPLDPSVGRVDPSEIDEMKRYHADRMYQAVLKAALGGFSAIKDRLAGSLGSFLFIDRPFFDVDVELMVPEITLSPSLDEIQRVLNGAAKEVLAGVQALPGWGPDLEGKSFFTRLGADREVIIQVLLLTGAMDTLRKDVHIYLERFEPFKFLFLTDMQAEYDAFMKTDPDLDAVEKELARYDDVDRRIQEVPVVHNLGPLSIETVPVKNSLRAMAGQWKAKFSQNLHEQAQRQLSAFLEYVSSSSKQLENYHKKVDSLDLDEISNLMGLLARVREHEADIDNTIVPIEDMYNLLNRFNVPVDKDEQDEVADLNYTWEKLRKTAGEVNDRLTELQSGYKADLVAQVREFVGDVAAFRKSWEDEGPMVPGLDPMVASSRLNQFRPIFEAKKARWERLENGEDVFGLPVTRYPELEKTKEELENLSKLYGLFVKVVKANETYKTTKWSDTVHQLPQLQEQLLAFKAESTRLPKGVKHWDAFTDCRALIEALNQQMPLIEAFASPDIRDRHWQQLQDITHVKLDLNPDVFSLGDLLACKLLEHQEDLEDLTNGASKEAAIEKKLEAIKVEWTAAELVFTAYRARGDVALSVPDTADLLERLEETTMNLQSMITNRYSAPFREDVMAWNAKISDVLEAIIKWMDVQNLWASLEVVFDGGDIVKSLPQEAKRFKTIDVSFMKLVTSAKEAMAVIEVCVTNEALKPMLDNISEQLEVCQKALSSYLEDKRAEFPRFYFVSDATLLQVLSVGSNPALVQPHFQSGLFDAIAAISFDTKDPSKITHMASRQKEVVPLDSPVDANGSIEVWLQRLVDGMKETVRGIIKRSTRDVEALSRDEFLFTYPAQIALLGIQLQWTAQLQTALLAAKTKKDVVHQARKRCNAILADLISLTTRGDLTSNQRTNLETVITVYVHQKDVADGLVDLSIRDPADFEWLKQARFYWRPETDSAIISITDADFEYSYEYLGVKERLVVTPLTDICYITLAQALNMCLGGAPAGPAGTGKTETVKDLGNTLGKYVVVFNCGDQFDYIYMGKIYRGLAQSGLWGCFDEFNRINLDVLSVCAQQVLCVLTAIRERRSKFTFTDGKEVDLDRRVGYFITMNPGYAGRQELPENLKSLFRGVTMMVPDRSIIMQVKLAACGYQENRPLSRKFFVLYALCEQQLSKQRHYDFGLRNILSVLRTAGASKRNDPSKSEPYLIMRTLRDMNMSKFVAEDVPLFISLIDDLFPGITAERASFPEIDKAMREVATAAGRQLHEPWLNKCIQLYETYLVRHGIMLVGPTGGGKTAIAETLAGALSTLGRKHVIKRMNPKAITAFEMFGKLDNATQDWTDGIFSVLWRRAAKDRTNNTWIVLDGPVDAIWIENLNTVLDDNRVLTLSNGDRIQMTAEMKAMFEPENLNNASPATVSRAGIIYVSDSELGWRPVVDSWLDDRATKFMRPRDKVALGDLFTKYGDKLLDIIAQRFHPVLANQPVCLMQSCCDLLEAHLSDATKASKSLDDAQYERVFLLCLTWSIGATLPAKEHSAFHAVLKECGASVGPKGLLPGPWTGKDPKEVAEDTIYEYAINPETYTWMPWKELVPEWSYPAGVEKPDYSSLVIPTVDSTRIQHIMTSLCHVRARPGTGQEFRGRPVLLVGDPGTAKSTIVGSFIDSLPTEGHTSKSVTFSYLTQPGIFQAGVEAALEKNPGRVFRPPGGRQMVMFIDDISMPEINAWGDQITNELVRQLLDEDGFYQLEKPIGDFKRVERVWYFAAMNTPGGGKNDVPNRLKRQFAVVNVNLPSKQAINDIFGTLVRGRFDPSIFDSGVVQVAEKLVPMTISLWTSIQKKMLPTPAKFHYLWNVRELSRVFQGVLLATTERFRSSPPDGVEPLGPATSAGAYLLTLWVHECHRVFVDKLVSYQDKDWAGTKIGALVSDAFGPNSEETIQAREPVHFVDWLRPPIEDEETGEIVEANPSFYEAVVGGIDEIRERVYEKQKAHNEASRSLKLELVYFDDAIKHLVRISRLLCMARGNGLLVGVGGSGKQSLTRMAAYIAGATPFQITITKTYSEKDLFEDLKTMYKLAGVKGQKVCFIFTDAEVKKESFLEYINQVLMTGEVAGLFPKDEAQMAAADCRPRMKKLRPDLIDTPDNLWSFFISQVRENLHVLLCFSPVGAKFGRRSQQFPGLINGCTIDWFLPWPEEALVAVSSKFLGEFPMACDDRVKAGLQRMCGAVHAGVNKACSQYFERFRRHVYVTPKSYLSFVNGFKELYTTKWGEVRKLSEAINAGLDKMKGAKKDVDKLKDELKVMNKEVEVKSKQVKEMLVNIGEKTMAAEKVKEKASKIAESAAAQAATIGEQEAEANAELAAAEPMLIAAVEAANKINADDVKKVMGIRPAPPSLVKRVFDTVLILNHKKVDSPLTYETNDKVKTLNDDGTVGKVISAQVPVSSWAESIKLDANKVPDDIKNFLDSGYMNDEVIEILYPYVSTADFWPLIARGSANALEGICGWARAVIQYYNVAKIVEPKRMSLKIAQGHLKVAMKEKAAADASLAEVQAQVDALQAQYDGAMREKQDLEDQAAMCERKMDAAAGLIGALSGEEVRWKRQASEFDDTIQRLSGDCAMASAFVSYLGPFNKEFRDMLLTKVFYQDCLDRGIPVTKNLDVSKFLVDESEVGEWNLDGLPTDDLSVQNGIMVTRASRFPVLVDPQGQGKTWLRAREERNGVVVSTLTDKHFRRNLEECLSDGKPLLIENIEEEIDPLLDPVLERRVVKKGRTMLVQLADKEVDFDPNFRIYFTTRLPAPHFSPELSAKVTVIDFTVTLSGLEDQLLGKLILKERNELEEQRKALLVEVNDYKKNIKSLEDSLLFRLSNSKGDLLDDTELIDVLANTKKTSQEVTVKLQVASETNEKIVEACEEFRPVAHRAALIYFLIAEFSSVNEMYQTSLKQFEELYDLGIDKSEKAAMPSKRIKNIIDYLTFSVYKYMQRGLFERHKTIFALMLTNKILASAGEIETSDINIFLKGGSELDIKNVRVQKPAGRGKSGESWIPDNVWLNLVALSEMRAFGDASGAGTKSILETVRQNDQLWNAWYDKEAPEASPVPEYEGHITQFERMCVVKAFRSDRTLIAAEAYIKENLGVRFVEGIPLDLAEAVDESTPTVPLVCILSRGADPTKLITDLARKRRKQVLGVSMGQGQEVIARGLMKQATEEGHWVLLQNTHLGLAYMYELEEHVLGEGETFHPDFRLWITADPHPDFPIGLLQMSIKITSEAPMGIKAGMRSSYAWINQDTLEQVPRQEWRQLLYLMCFTHSLVQERRKFGPIGWNVPYEFNQSDLSACVAFLQNHLLDMEAKRAAQPTWETVRYMISVIMYGGRITDDLDQITMDTYADRYFTQDRLATHNELFRDDKAGFVYVVPDGTEVEVFRDEVEKFPTQDSPEVFGLHSNADLTFRTLQVAEMVDTILDTMPKSGGGGKGETREDRVDRLCQERLGTVPPNFDKYEVKERIRKLGATDPLTVHLRQEIDRLNKVISLTRTTLEDLRLAIAGTIVLSSDLLEALDALFAGRVPPTWTAISWESSGMGTWFSQLTARHEQLHRWLFTGRPKSYWMTGFFNAGGFLTAALQEITRAHAKTKDKWALDDVTMESVCTGKAVEALAGPPPEGVYVHGLFLDGCAWSVRENKLVDAQPKVVINPLPVLHVAGTVSKKTAGTYQTPCYKIKKRTGLNYITRFDLRTDAPVSKWVLRGVALLCSAD